MSLRPQLRPGFRPRYVGAAFSRGLRVARESSGDDCDAWLKGDGLKYKTPQPAGSNWLGGIRPFPLNPSFRPPPPIADKTKNQLFTLYKSNPKKFSIRVLSAAYGIGLKRVDAIIRLKEVELDWVKDKPLQTGFVAGMEHILGTAEHVIGSIPAVRNLVSAADIQDQREEDDHARDRYHRLFWETVDENEEPIVQESLEQAKEETREASSARAKAKSDPFLLTGRMASKSKSTPEAGAEAEDASSPKVLNARRGPSRPLIKFKDVGGQFLDVEDRMRRLRAAERRKAAKVEARKARRS